MKRIIDLRSDTVTLPTPEMMDAIQQAQLGDDVYGEDIATRELEEYAAELFGKEAGLFVTSGTMGNLVAALTHTQRRRSEVIAERKAHMFDYEGGNLAHFGGISVNALDGMNGMLSEEQVKTAIRDPENLHHPITSLLCLENTHANAGGTILPQDGIHALRELADHHGISMHLDGARIFNAAVASGRSVKDLAADFDSVQICLSKGLSAPVGSVLMGSRDFIQEARHMRKLLGGGMRQCGIMAAPGLIALRTMIPRLAEDHANAKRLACGLAQVEGISVDLDSVQTNIVCAFVEQTGRQAEDLVRAFDQHGVRCLARGAYKLRFILHRHITAQDVDLALEIMENALKS